MSRTDHPRRVAMVAAFPYPTAQGTQALVGELCRGLSARGHDVHLVCYHHGAFERKEPFAIHRIPRVPGYRRLRAGPDALKPLLDLLVARKATRVIREQRCELVHAHNYEGALAGAVAAQRNEAPLVYHAHNLMQDELPLYATHPAVARSALALGLALDYTVPRLARRVIAIHDKLARALIARGVPEAQIATVEPGIETGFWMRRAPRSGAEPPRVVYAGNIDAYQDLPTLFRAMKRVVAEMPAARLLLATPNDPSEARRLAATHGAAGVTDVVAAADAEAARDALHRAEVAVSPRSSWSGFPVKNLNYAAAGLPVVACAGSASGLRNGRTGLVVPDGESAAMADALLSLLRDPGMARRCGAEGQKLARARYGISRMVEQVERVWAAV